MSVKKGIVILDFGGQYTQLIARRIREFEVFSSVLPCSASIEEVKKWEPRGIVLSGGPSSVYEASAPKCTTEVLRLGVPVLGICYGMHWMVHNSGGQVQPAERREYGPASIELSCESPLFKGVPKNFKVWNSHGDHVVGLAKTAKVTALTSNAIAAVEDPQERFYAVEFHPEVNHTEYGTDILRNFVFEICEAKKNWSRAGFIEETVAAIREKAQGGAALCALSGGVDSTVAAALVHKAIGDRLTNVFVNTGLLRRNEFEETLSLLRDRVGLKVDGVDASARFLGKLAGVTDPEKKRKIIGAEFIGVFAEEARKLAAPKSGASVAVGASRNAISATAGSGSVVTANAASVGEAEPIKFLVQGTLYPDVIESVSVKGPSAVIKSHHNVGGLPKDMPFELIEPLRDLFKDEVRRIGKELGLPDEILTKHPFPGPGLAVRLLGEITEERLETLRAADAVVVEEIRRAGLYEKVWQAFAVLLPVRSVGVMGDGRTYGDTVVVRVVESLDAMTADWSRLPMEVLGRISTRVVNEVPGVSRVVYDISSKPPSTIEWE
jgi:GMP synthase (glutamine-hydrolysing)